MCRQGSDKGFFFSFLKSFSHSSLYIIGCRQLSFSKNVRRQKLFTTIDNYFAFTFYHLQPFSGLGNGIVRVRGESESPSDDLGGEGGGAGGRRWG